MMRSLYSGISGLRNHQTRMDVIGNNIANVNTAGFKASRVIFQDIFSQTLQGGSANTGAMGGTNSAQVGLGMRLSSIDVLHTRSAFQATNQQTDMMIDGDGFFVVASPRMGYLTDAAGDLITDDDDEPIWGQLRNFETNEPIYDMSFTRAGNFSIDDNGYLVTSHGYFVLGHSFGLGQDAAGVWGLGHFPSAADRHGTELTETTLQRIFVGGTRERTAVDIERWEAEWAEQGRSAAEIAILVAEREAEFDYRYGEDRAPERRPNFTVDQNGTLSVLAGAVQMDFGQLQVAMFNNPAGLERIGSSLFRETSSSGDANIVNPRDTSEGSGQISAGGLEMSNVDLASEFTDMIVTQRGFQANSRIITVSDTMLEELVNLKR